MKTLLFTLFLISFSLGAKDKVKKGFLQYEGMFFTVEYPKTFTPIPDLTKFPKSELPDNARFVSPDKKVEFYVHAPQWSAEDEYSKLDEKKEKLQSSKEEKDKNGYVHKWYTYQAKNGSYSRAFHEVRHPDFNTLKIIGIKFSSQADYDKYKKDYLHFKSSLKQFAD
ncbi:MAG: hypothetical protein N3A69_04540 [Leptospiraceae bacterium]|nr:hypothetical protein [Leptospiraceae bacterium]